MKYKTCEYRDIHSDTKRKRKAFIQLSTEIKILDINNTSQD